MYFLNENVRTTSSQAAQQRDTPTTSSCINLSCDVSIEFKSTMICTFAKENDGNFSYCLHHIYSKMVSMVTYFFFARVSLQFCFCHDKVLIRYCCNLRCIFHDNVSLKIYIDFFHGKLKLYVAMMATFRSVFSHTYCKNVPMVTHIFPMEILIFLPFKNMANLTCSMVNLLLL